MLDRIGQNFIERWIMYKLLLEKVIQDIYVGFIELLVEVGVKVVNEKVRNVFVCYGVWVIENNCVIILLYLVEDVMCWIFEMFKLYGWQVQYDIYY